MPTAQLDNNGVSMKRRSFLKLLAGIFPAFSVLPRPKAEHKPAPIVADTKDYAPPEHLTPPPKKRKRRILSSGSALGWPGVFTEEWRSNEFYFDDD